MELNSQQPSDKFAHVIDQWKDWCSSPIGQIRFSTSRLNIQRHLSGKKLKILDVGGGNGLDSIYYARQRHLVTLFDGSPAMLAEAKTTAAEQGVLKQLTIYQGDIGDIKQIMSEQRFDLILCHLVLEFLSDPLVFLGELCQLLAPGGLLSVIDPNRYSLTYCNAFYTGNISEANKAIGIKQYFHSWVNRLTPIFSAEEIIAQLQASGCILVGQYGIHNVFYYLPDDRKSDPQSIKELEQLEHKLTGTYPYYLLARFYQVIVQNR
jgi:S-adenosylmethionine-dependent methyltransferase